MTSWRDAILSDFVPNVSKLTLVADPDSLLTEEKLLVELRRRGFDLIEFTDPVEFRYAYESQYRAIWDSGKTTDLVVVLRFKNASLETLPYDLLQSGRSLSFNLGDLFPNLSYKVIEDLDRALLDDVFAAQAAYKPERLGDDATRDFILLHVFEMTATLIKDPVNLLQALLRLHYGNTRIPSDLGNRLVRLLQSNKAFADWPLDQIVLDAKAFYAFLQERWPLYLKRCGASQDLHEIDDEYGLAFSGPQDLPFDHQDIRVYLDNLFLEGQLSPVQVERVNASLDSWVLSGITSGDGEDVPGRIDRLFERVEATVPPVDARFTEWTIFAQKMAELAALVHSNSSADITERLWAISDSCNSIFGEWLDVHYSSLANQPSVVPAMVHHLLSRRLARNLIEDPKGYRCALIVVDGMALDQWVTIRGALKDQDATITTRDHATFAWIPTITPVSRQAIFSGKQPLYFPNTIASTNYDDKAWRQFWENAGMPKADVVYRRGLGKGNAVDDMEALIHPTKTRAVGLVVDTLDKIMHGMELGGSGMHNQVAQWCAGGYLQTLFSYLLDLGFDVWITADHGNIECRGKGKPTEGAIADSRGERVRIYPTAGLRDGVAASFDFAHPWEPAGLPPDYFPLLADGRDAFVQIGDMIVAHGGRSMQEVIVPLVQIERKKT